MQGNKVVNMGRIRGTIQKEFFGLPATGKSFDCQYCQVAFIEKERSSTFETIGISWTCITRLAGTLPH